MIPFKRLIRYIIANKSIWKKTTYNIEVSVLKSINTLVCGIRVDIDQYGVNFRIDHISYNHMIRIYKNAYGNYYNQIYRNQMKQILIEPSISQYNIYYVQYSINNETHTKHINTRSKKEYPKDLTIIWYECHQAFKKKYF